MKNSKLLLIPAILIPLGVGIASALLTKDSMDVYGTVTKPALAPPAILFPIVWTLLYLMMGVASYFVWTADSPVRMKTVAGSWYLIQLTMNFFWSIIFFRFGMYTAAFFWLIGMYVAVIVCTVTFFLVRHAAGWLMIPYNLWMAVAAYLNLSIVLLNR